MMNLSIDSRLITDPESTVFFAFRGKNNDGHDYVVGLYERGVRNFVVSENRREYSALTEANMVCVEDVMGALQEYAGEMRAQTAAEIIAVTGSNGKTIVKEWLYQALVEEYAVYRSPKSYNSQVGVPLSLAGIGAAEVAIIEAGISERGEMERLERMIRPDVVVFTHFGDAHGENFASEEEKLAEKAVLFRRAGAVVGKAGREMDFILSTMERKDAVRMRWGSEGEVRAEIVEADSERRVIRITYGRESFLLTIPFPDEASYENCMHVVCVMLLKGIAPEKIVRKIAALQPVAMRLEIREGINGCVLINDYYNSDVTSFSLALNTLMMQDGSRKKMVILSDFVDVPGDREALYRKVAGMLLAAGVERFVGIGGEICRYKALFPPYARFYIDTDRFLNNEERSDYRECAILIKGARKYCFEYIANFLQLQSHNTLLEVDMDAMLGNFNYFRSLVPGKTKIAVMVKAFSYGSGSGEVANFLQHHGAACFMVAFADEGVDLRAEGITLPVVVMNPEPEVFDNMIEFNLEPEIYSLELLAAFDKALAKHGVENYPVHIKLNTGMNRSGFNRPEIAGLLDWFACGRRVVIRSVFSHLAAADEEAFDDFTCQQAADFTVMAALIQERFKYKIMRHLLNSAGMERFGEYAFDMVRLGIGVHGISAAGARLTPVSSFKSYIMAIRQVVAGETVGYGRRGAIGRDSRIAVVPVGYADGLNRKLGNGTGAMYVFGKKAPIVGNICMDTCMLDITDIDAQVGDEVEIFGKHILVTDVAAQLDTIPYELLTQVARRVRRVYFKE